MLIRRATTADAGPIAAIYAAGVAEGSATFQVDPLEASAFEGRIHAGDLFLVAEEEGIVLGVAWVSDYDPVHDYYAGVGESTLYVGPGSRRRGAGRALLEALGAGARDAGRHKLVAKIFATNQPSLELFRASGYRQVGTHHRHGELRGEWIDVIVVERRLSGG